MHSLEWKRVTWRQLSVNVLASLAALSLAMDAKMVTSLPDQHQTSIVYFSNQFNIFSTFHLIF